MAACRVVVVTVALLLPACSSPPDRAPPSPPPPPAPPAPSSTVTEPDSGEACLGELFAKIVVDSNIKRGDGESYALLWCATELAPGATVEEAMRRIRAYLLAGRGHGPLTYQPGELEFLDDPPHQVHEHPPPKLRPRDCWALVLTDLADAPQGGEGLSDSLDERERWIASVLATTADLAEAAAPRLDDLFDWLSLDSSLVRTRVDVLVRRPYSRTYVARRILAALDGGEELEGFGDAAIDARTFWCLALSDVLGLGIDMPRTGGAAQRAETTAEILSRARELLGRAPR